MFTEVTFYDFLVFLTTGAGAAMAIAWLAERVPAFQTLTSDQKWWAQLIGSVAVGLAAFAAIQYLPAATLDAIAPWFAVVYGITRVWLANQAAHAADPLRRERG